MAARYGLTPGDVRREAAIVFGSVGDRGTLVRRRRRRGLGLQRAFGAPNLSDVGKLLIDTPGGGHVPLGKVATLTVNSTPSDITRVNGSNKIDVTANVAGGNLGSATAAVQARLAQIKLPLGYHIELLGEGAERQAAQQAPAEMGSARRSRSSSCSRRRSRACGWRC